MTPASLLTMRSEALPPNFVKAWREKRGLKQEELGEAVGTTGSVISLLETGRRQLTQAWLTKLAAALNTTPGLLLDHDPDHLPVDILDLWARIPDGERNRARQVLEAFVNLDAA